MGTGEETTTSKSSKPASSSQEMPTTAAYPDWSSPMQAYYGAGATPPPFFASTVASPAPHPYIWGGQHPMMPHYGTPVPYPAIYPPGGVYAHPNMTMTPGSAPPNNSEVIGKGADGKDGASSKKNKGTAENAGSGGNKVGDGVKVTSGSGNDGGSHSGESGSEDSSDANEDNNQQEFGTSGTAQNSAAGTNAQASVTGKPVNSGPATNLNIGMDLWNSSPAAGAAKMRPTTASSAMVPSAMMSDQWIQDERELKRQRRKQSNRESARRSRLRKQAECDELQVRVETLTGENQCLREEMQRLSEECEKLASENSSIKEELTRLCGPEAVDALEKNSGTGQSERTKNED